MPKTFLKLRYLILAAAIALSLLMVRNALKPQLEPAPETVFGTITGKKIALQALRGRPVIVTFWATDCPACIDEIPQWVDWYGQYHERGLEIIAVAMFYDPPSHVVSMAKAKRLPYDVALDLTGAQARAFGNVSLTPTTFLISPDGMIAEHKIGAIDPRQMKTRIEALLTKG